VDHSPEEPLGASSAAFYEPDGLARAMCHLRPGGVLGVWSHQESERLAQAFGVVSRDSRVEPVTFFDAVVEAEAVNWLYFGRRND
jgi:hypothetical protein